MKKILIIVMLFAFLNGKALAIDRILIGGLTIKLGDNQTTTMEKVKKYHKLKFSDPLYLIYDLNENLIGSIHFSRNKVTGVNKNWGTYSVDQGTKILKSLFSAVSSIPENQRNAVVSIFSKREPTLSNEDLVLDFGRREIRVGIIEQTNQTTIQISETLFKQ